MGRFLRAGGRAAIAGIAFAASLAAAGPATVSPEYLAYGAAHSWGDGLSSAAAVSANGRFVAFDSSDPDLVPGDANGTFDVFLLDRDSGETTLVSANPDGAPGDGTSTQPSLSADGRFVLFLTTALDIVDSNPDTWERVVVFDRRTGRLRLVSAAADGTPADSSASVRGGALSANGRWAAFLSDADNLTRENRGFGGRIFLKDLRTGRVVNASTDRYDVGCCGEIRAPSISPGGRFVVFAGPGPYGEVYRWDRRTGNVRVVTLPPEPLPDSGWNSDPVVSDSGRWVAFASRDADLVEGDLDELSDVFLHDLRTGTRIRLSTATGDAEDGDHSAEMAMSRDGSTVAFRSRSRLVPEDSNDDGDLYLWESSTGALRLLTKGPDGKAVGGESSVIAGSMSANGRWLAFASSAPELFPEGVGGDGTFGVFLLDLRAEE